MCLGQGVDEEAAFERLLLEPLVEGFEDREQLFVGRLAALLDLRLEPVPRPDVGVALDDSNDEPSLDRQPRSARCSTARSQLGVSASAASGAASVGRSSTLRAVSASVVGETPATWRTSSAA